LSVLAVNTQVARAIIRKPHVTLWPKRLDTPAIAPPPIALESCSRAQMDWLVV